MSGIAGTTGAGNYKQVDRMLTKMSHRGPAGQEIIEIAGSTMGVSWTEAQAKYWDGDQVVSFVKDGAGTSRLAQAEMKNGSLVIRRDPLGIAPLYYGKDSDGQVWFASEVKALLEVTQDVNELPPGCWYDGTRVEKYAYLKKARDREESTEDIITGLRQRLESSVRKRIKSDRIGCWLSGGLDSSTMAALARPYVNSLYTFAAGVPGAPDLESARAVAEHLHTKHYEAIVTFDEMLKVLPAVIYHLESFDAWLVRSTITNWMVAKLASDYVPDVFSGEGGDELFAGYDYLKALDPSMLADELIDITGRLHNTALQRVDRSAAAHGIVAYVGFLSPEVVDYAVSIPSNLKLHDGVEKWILRQAMIDDLPEGILNRHKAKFWEGAGVGEQLADYAEAQIRDADFHRERNLPNGWKLNTKEELLYYRIFKECFGELGDLSWMGRTKGSPVH